MTKKGNGGKGGSPYKEEKGYDKDWPPKPKPVKTAKKNKKSNPLTEKSDTPYGQPEKAKNPWDDRSNVV